MRQCRVRDGHPEITDIGENKVVDGMRLRGYTEERGLN
jgi:hypothetical protein